MRRGAARTPESPRRSGKFFVFFALILPVLLGMTGLTIDAGLLMAVRRQTQNAADAAALAASRVLLRGGSVAEARAKAIEYVQANGLMTDAMVSVEVNSPPLQGPFQVGGYVLDPANYVEVIVTAPMTTIFIRAVGVAPVVFVHQRAVAGPDPVPYQIYLLDPEAVPGLTVFRIAFQVAGGIAVNSEGAGVDENGGEVDLDRAPHAAKVGGSQGAVTSPYVQVVGGVDSAGNFSSPSGSESPLHAGVGPDRAVADPAADVPPPTTSSSVRGDYFPDREGVNRLTPQDVTVDVSAGETITLQPGIYSSISITGEVSETGEAGTVRFMPGIYVLKGGNSEGQALNIFTDASVVGDGVLFYNTGSDYDPGSGAPDASDAGRPPASLGSTRTGRIDLSGPHISLTGLRSPGSPFDQMLIYQRRWNTSNITIVDPIKSRLEGTIYSKWGYVNVIGPGSLPLHVIARAMIVTRSDELGLLEFTLPPGVYRRPYLVE